MKITLLDRYLIKQLWSLGLFSILLFTICWLAPEILFKAIHAYSNGKVTFEQALIYLFYQVPIVLVYCIPISALFASVFLFRQLSLSSELTAMLASGISFKRVMVPVAVAGMGFTLLFFMTQEFWVPFSTAHLRELNRQTHIDKAFATRTQVTYVEKDDNGLIDKFLVISPETQEKNNKFIFLFFKHEKDKNRIYRIVTATAGKWIEDRNAWELTDGINYLISRDGIYKAVESFDQLRIKTSPVANALLAFPTGNPGEFRVRDLERYVRLLSRGGQTEDARFYGVRLWQRYFLPWAPMLLAVLGMAIGVERSRMRRNLGLTYAAAILLFYNIMVPVATTMGSIGLLFTPIAAMLPLILTAGVGYGIIRLRQAEA